MASAEILLWNASSWLDNPTSSACGENHLCLKKSLENSPKMAHCARMSCAV